MTTRKNMRKHGGSTCMRNGRMSGGNLGQGFRNGAEMLTRGYPVNEAYNTCGAMSRAGQLSTDSISMMGKGLPGLAGGSRRAQRKGRRASRKGRKASRKSRRAQRKMRGGRYEAVLQGAEFEALGPRGGMLATAGTLPCERGAGAYISPTQSTLPARQAGGAAQLAPAPFLQEQTAGYTMRPSTWLDSVGAPLELRTPVGGQMPVPACKTTGGGRGKKMRGGVEEPVTPSYPSSLALIDNMESNPAYQAAQAQAIAEGANSGRAAKLRAQANAEAAAANAEAANAGTEAANTGTEAANAAAANAAAANAAAANAAAATGGSTGGRRRNRKVSRKARKSSRKARKSSRKARKSSRKSSRKH